MPSELGRARRRDARAAGGGGDGRSAVERTTPVLGDQYPVTARQQAVLRALLGGKRTVAQVTERLGAEGAPTASDATTRRDLRALRRLGLVALQTGRRGGWTLAGDDVRLAREDTPAPER